MTDSNVDIGTPNHQENGKVINNPWRQLREFTDARIGLGRAGISLPTNEMLAFQLSHAQARDAVHFPLDVDTLCGDLLQLPMVNASLSPLRLQSKAPDRITYLQRPDLGRSLNDDSRTQLNQLMPNGNIDSQCDLAIVIVDGLSSLAVQKNAVPFLQYFLPLFMADGEYVVAPTTIVEQGRVAIGDDIGERLNARAVMVLIGERPGLSSPDSLGLYFTFAPKTGLNDASRNCISNIRPAGLAYNDAAKRALYLWQESQRLKLSGVNLKDRTNDGVIEFKREQKNFLVSD